MVIDTSALLAIYFNEKHASWVVKHLSECTTDMMMSTVNLAEILILLKKHQPKLLESIREELLQSSITFVPPTAHHAQIAARARDQFPLNLGDCFAYALAYEEEVPLLTLDRDFKKTDIKVYLPA